MPVDSGQKLFDAAKEPKELWFEPDVEHVAFDTTMPEKFEEKVIGFLNRSLLEK